MVDKMRWDKTRGCSITMAMAAAICSDTDIKMPQVANLFYI